MHITSLQTVFDCRYINFYYYLLLGHLLHRGEKNKTSAPIPDWAIHPTRNDHESDVSVIEIQIMMYSTQNTSTQADLLKRKNRTKKKGGKARRLFLQFIFYDNEYHNNNNNNNNNDTNEDFYNALYPAASAGKSTTRLQKDTTRWNK